jgi:hypothetical protein
VNASLPLQALLGLVVGLACTAGHFALLQRQLDRVWELQVKGARAHMLGGLPLRLLMWAPAAALTLWIGQVACIALFVALIIGRWALLGAFAARRGRVSEVSERGC